VRFVQPEWKSLKVILNAHLFEPLVQSLKTQHGSSGGTLKKSPLQNFFGRGHIFQANIMASFLAQK